MLCGPHRACVSTLLSCVCGRGLGRMKWALPRVQRVEQRVMQLLQEWPDHSVLNYMRRTCRSLLCGAWQPCCAWKKKAHTPFADSHSQTNTDNKKDA